MTATARPLATLALPFLLLAPGRDDSVSPSSPDRLTMTPVVACASISGYQQYEPLPEAAVTKDDKLILYYEPKHFATEKVGEIYQAHFVQDVRIRRRGRKEVVWKRDKLFETRLEGPAPGFTLYLHNKLALKGLAPGPYDLDIILHDMKARGATAEQTLHFEVKPAKP